MGYIGVFIVALIFYLIKTQRKKGFEKFKNGTEVKLLVNVFKVDITKINFKVFSRYISVANAVTIALSFFIIISIKNLLIAVLCSFGTIILLTGLSYLIVGKHYQRRKKNV